MPKKQPPKKKPTGKTGRKPPVPAPPVPTAPTVPSSAPFTDVNALSVVAPGVAAQILAAAVQIGNGTQAAPQEQPLRFVTAQAATKPGKERWPVKTGQDPDVGLVAKNVINGQDLGEGIVPATVEELIAVNRPPDMRPVTKEFPAYQNKRRETVEVTVWQVDGEITVVKLEADGDYHLVISGATGETMIAEVPTPTAEFIGNSPWMANIQAARSFVDETFVKQLDPRDFTPVGGKLVPRASVSGAPQALPVGLPSSFVPQPGKET